MSMRAQVWDKYPINFGINIPILTAFDPGCAIYLTKSLDRVAAAIQTSTKPLNETVCGSRDIRHRKIAAAAPSARVVCWKGPPLTSNSGRQEDST